MQALHIGLLVSKCRLCDQLPIATTRSGDGRLELIILKKSETGSSGTGPNGIVVRGGRNEAEGARCNICAFLHRVADSLSHAPMHECGSGAMANVCGAASVGAAVQTAAALLTSAVVHRARLLSEVGELHTHTATSSRGCRCEDGDGGW